MVVGEKEERGCRGTKGCEIYGRCECCAFLVGEVINLGSKVDFVVESGLHVLTSRTITPVSKAT